MIARLELPPGDQVHNLLGDFVADRYLRDSLDLRFDGGPMGLFHWRNACLSCCLQIYPQACRQKSRLNGHTIVKRPAKPPMYLSLEYSPPQANALSFLSGVKGSVT